MARRFSGIQVTGRYGFGEKPVSSRLLLEESKRIAVRMAHNLYDELNRVAEELWGWKELAEESEGDDKQFANCIADELDTQLLHLEKKISSIERNLV